MALFGRKPKRDARDKPISQVELKRAVDEGFLIAKSAVTITVANRIITNALRDEGYFDHALIAEAARDELRRMAGEQRGDAERMREIRSKSSKTKGRSRHQHDYRRGDDLKLRTREATYEELARQLDERAEENGFVDGIVLTARARAWDDIGATVVGRLDFLQAPGEGYEIGLDDRVQQLLDEDFAELLAEHPIGSGPAPEEDADGSGVDPDDGADPDDGGTDADDGGTDADGEDEGTDPADADTVRP